MIFQYLVLIVLLVWLAKTLNRAEKIGLRCAFGRHDKRGTYQRVLMDNFVATPAGVTRGLACIRKRCDWIEPDGHELFIHRVGPIWWYRTPQKRVLLEWSVKRYPEVES